MFVTDYTLIGWKGVGTLLHGGKRYAADSRSSVLNRPSQRLGELTAKTLRRAFVAKRI